YTCRAGTVTSRYYGETEELLGRYAWFLENAKEVSWPVGSKKPNDLGLFDMHGNGLCWCQETYGEYPEAKAEQIIDDIECGVRILPTVGRAMRGGSFGGPAGCVRVSPRPTALPAARL